MVGSHYYISSKVLKNRSCQFSSSLLYLCKFPSTRQVVARTAAAHSPWAWRMVLSEYWFPGPLGKIQRGLRKVRVVVVPPFTTRWCYCSFISIAICLKLPICYQMKLMQRGVFFSYGAMYYFHSILLLIAVVNWYGRFNLVVYPQILPRWFITTEIV